MEEVLRETKSRVRIGEEIGEFLDGKGFEAMLFNVLLADLVKIGRVKGGSKIRLG